MWGSCTSPPSNRESKIGMGWEGSGCPVVVRGTTQEYRRALAAVVRSEDICVEIGSAAGVTTIQLARKCVRAIGVDSAPGEVAGAIANAIRDGLSTTTTTLKDEAALSASSSDDDNTKVALVQFIVAQVRHDDCEVSLEPLVAVLGDNKFGHSLLDVTLLAVDVAGTAPLECITPLIVSLRRVMKPRVTVVKSLTLKKLLVAVEAGEALVAGWERKKERLCGFRKLSRLLIPNMVSWRNCCVLGSVVSTTSHDVMLNHVVRSTNGGE